MYVCIQKVKFALIAPTIISSPRFIMALTANKLVLHEMPQFQNINTCIYLVYKTQHSVQLPFDIIPEDVLLVKLFAYSRRSFRIRMIMPPIIHGGLKRQAYHYYVFRIDKLAQKSASFQAAVLHTLLILFLGTKIKMHCLTKWLHVNLWKQSKLSKEGVRHSSRAAILFFGPPSLTDIKKEWKVV